MRLQMRPKKKTESGDLFKRGQQKDGGQVIYFPPANLSNERFDQHIGSLDDFF
jgi:hypothetical protein